MLPIPDSQYGIRRLKGFDMALVSLKGALDKILKEYKLSKDLEAYRVFTDWGSLVGDRLAGHAKPVRINDGILYIEVDDPLWLVQIKYMKGIILQKIDSGIKKGALKDLRFFLKSI
jgi:predicted nucleic acid-binding Zn ribbon protein